MPPTGSFALLPCCPVALPYRRPAALPPRRIAVSPHRRIAFSACRLVADPFGASTRLRRAGCFRLMARMCAAGQPSADRRNHPPSPARSHAGTSLASSTRPPIRRTASFPQPALRTARPFKRRSRIASRCHACCIASPCLAGARRHHAVAASPGIATMVLANLSCARQSARTPPGRSCQAGGTRHPSRERRPRARPARRPPP
ncbi:hypothetical protein BLA9940_00796 [Burkholderia aenigmatica]|nr:hypothetical protein BLA9940_00796 [Burkholderia aenigmatica]